MVALLSKFRESVLRGRVVIVMVVQMVGKVLSIIHLVIYFRYLIHLTITIKSYNTYGYHFQNPNCPLLFLSDRPMTLLVRTLAFRRQISGLPILSYFLLFLVAIFLKQIKSVLAHFFSPFPNNFIIVIIIIFSNEIM